MQDSGANISAEILSMLESEEGMVSQELESSTERRSTSRKRPTEGGDDRADRKRERERRRRAEVGLKFEELIKVLNKAEALTLQGNSSDEVLSEQNADDMSRVAILNRAIAALNAFTSESPQGSDLMSVAALATQRLHRRDAETQTEGASNQDDELFLVAKMKLPHNFIFASPPFTQTTTSQDQPTLANQHQISAAFNDFINAQTNHNEQQSRIPPKTTTSSQQNPSDDLSNRSLDRMRSGLEQVFNSRNGQPTEEDHTHTDESTEVRPRAMSVTSVLEQVLTSSAPTNTAKRVSAVHHRPASYFARSAL